MGGDQKPGRGQEKVEGREEGGAILLGDQDAQEMTRRRPGTGEATGSSPSPAQVPPLLTPPVSETEVTQGMETWESRDQPSPSHTQTGDLFLLGVSVLFPFIG